MRIFAFGCSFTQYVYPTWADIIAKHYGVEYRNCAMSGFGNTAILCRLAEADLRYKFCSDDLILVMWSTAAREDRFIGDQWVAVGNIYNQKFYNQDFLERYVSEEDFLLKSMTAIHTGRKIVEDSGATLIESQMASLIEQNPPSDRVAEIQSLIKIAEQGIPSMKAFLGAGFLKKKKRYLDVLWHESHPYPKEHLAFVEGVVGLTVRQDVVDWVNEWEEEVISSRHWNKCKFFDFGEDPGLF